ncbi:hypothetical protein G7Y89_g83 [Cudoniella acicularis]|uniref:Uncharacterized protein n=1 Tax=Cudoniella acicularis TaxID=354080 RepID=A0A8H4RZI4_9HELO|nr:hypothetical protein G7Y89_g83 [Cudoniella acicularis]
MGFYLSKVTLGFHGAHQRGPETTTVMTPVHPPTGDAASRGNAETGRDRLATIQLRKENSAIHEQLKELPAIAKRLNGFEERLTTLESNYEAKFSKVQEELRQIKKKDEAWNKELLELKAQVKDLTQKMIPSAEIDAFNLQVERDRAKDRARREAEAPSREHRQIAAPTTITNKPIVPQAPSPKHQVLDNPNNPTISKATLPNHLRTPPGHIVTDKALRPISNTAARRPATHTVKASHQPLPVEDPVLKEAPPATPQLKQSHRSIRAYFTMAEKIHGTFSKVSVTFEHAFVDAFVQGLNSEKNRELLINALQQRHPSAIGEGGTTKILCRWEDVEGPLEKSGLLGKDTGKDKDMKSTKRKKLNGQDLLSDRTEKVSSDNRIKGDICVAGDLL